MLLLSILLLSALVSLLYKEGYRVKRGNINEKQQDYTDWVKDGASANQGIKKLVGRAVGTQ